MKDWLRKAYVGLAWLLVAGVVIQFLLVGLALFAGYGFGPHTRFGEMFLVGAPVVLLVLAVAGRLSRRMIGLSLHILVVVLIQAALPGLRSSLPFAAALHPVNALWVLWSSVRLAQRARADVLGPPVQTLSEAG